MSQHKIPNKYVILSHHYYLSFHTIPPVISFPAQDHTFRWRWARDIEWELEWRHQMETFSGLLAICAGNSPVPTQRPVTRSFDFFICAWINGWVKNGKAGDLRRHRAHYGITVMAKRPRDLSQPELHNYTSRDILSACERSHVPSKNRCLRLPVFIIFRDVHYVYSFITNMVTTTIRYHLWKETFRQCVHFRYLIATDAIMF